MSERKYYSEQSKQRAQREQFLLIGVFLALGLSIGTALAILFAPQSGEETREEIINRAEKQFESGRETTEKTMARLQEDFNKLRALVEERLN